MDKSNSNGISSANAVLLGALASGVNTPTWNAVKITFTMLAFCLTSMLMLAFTAHDLAIAGHVLFLVFLSGVLFLLLNSFLSQTGLVSVEQQIQEMGLSESLDVLLEDKSK